jgi:glycosyltransferase involved in cell wall biosynthesis
MLRGKDIVCVSSLDWGAMWGTMHQVMHRLAQGNRVLYVEEPVTMLAPLKVPGRVKRWAAVVPRLRRGAEPGLWILTPPPLLPFGNMRPAVNRANQAVLAWYIRWAMKRLEFREDAILWAYLPTAVALVGSLAGRKSRGGARRPGWPGLVVYHCVDEHSAFPGFVSPDVVAGYDDDLTRRADLVITTSENLRRSRETVNPHTYTVVNAADFELFNRALDPTVPVPADLAAIPMPRLAIIGFHDSRLDIDALEELSKADPTWQIVLIGPVKAGQVDEGLLRGYANIHLLGEKPRTELPGYLKGVSVALIPYKTNALTQNIFPLKLFEYLAAGVPVVVGGLPELRKFQGVIGVADSPRDYPRLVRQEMARDGRTARAERIALAGENTWERRVEEISLLVEEALRRRVAAAE